MSRFYLPTGKKMRRRAAGGNCTTAEWTSDYSAGVSRARQGSSGRRSRAKPRPGGQASAGTGHRCTEAVAGHSHRVVKCAVQGENRSASRRDLGRTSSFSSVPKASGSWETAERISNSKGSIGEHIAEKIRQKFLAKRNTTRFDRSLKNGRSFFLSTFTSVENLAKNMFSFSIEMLHSRRRFPHRRLCPSRLRSPISSA